MKVAIGWRSTSPLLATIQARRPDTWGGALVC